MGELVIPTTESARVPCLCARDFISICAILEAWTYSVKSMVIVSHRMILLSVDVIRHSPVSIKLTRGLPVQGLLLVAVSSGGARRSWIIKHIVVEVLIIHSSLT